MVSPSTATAAAVLPVLLVWAGAVDIVTRSIPNRLVLLLSGSFMVFAGLAGLSATQILAHAVCAFAVLACGFVLFSQSLVGGGDAKLMAAAALWFGFEKLPPLLVETALAGGLLALAYLVAYAIRSQLQGNTQRASTIPYGVAIAAGGLAVFPDWMTLF